MLVTIYYTKWPILCRCAVKKLLTHLLILKLRVHTRHTNRRTDGQDP